MEVFAHDPEHTGIAEGGITDDVPDVERGIARG
jgi:hypothetical protein